MTGLKIVTVSALIGLVAVIDSDHIDSWAKLTAIPILGAVIVALLCFQRLERKETLAAHTKSWKSVTNSLDGIREDNKDHQKEHIELLQKMAGRKD